jgi:formylglycine-generating enzyme required for sulfatase activity
LRVLRLHGLALIVLALPAPAQAAERAAHDLVPIGRTQLAIDRHEVTIGQFRAFARATGTRTKAERDGGGFQYLGGWQRMAGWTWERPHGEPARDDEPAVHVTWDEAVAYCTWAGLALPTDAQWLAAAYTEHRDPAPAPLETGKTYPYPTGASPDAANQITSPLALPVYPAPRTVLGQGRGHAPVKTTPAGVNGLHDMGGNVWEWVDHDVSGQKRTRGGSWWYGAAQMRADALYEKARDFPAVYIGFRCAMPARRP